MKVQFEYTPPGSPQFNGVVERKFKTLYERVRSLLNSAGLDKELREGLWAEAAQYATDIENLLVTPSKTHSSWFAFYQRDHPILRNIRQFGEVAIVEEHRTRGMRSKLEDRGKPCIYLGRAKDHASDTYRFLSLDSKRIIFCRDVTWLNKNYATYKNIDGVRLIDDDTLDPVEVITTTTTHSPIVPDIAPVPPEVVPAPEPEPAPDPVPLETPAPRVTRELSRLGTDLSVVDLSEHRSLRSGRALDTGNVVVPLSDLCFLSVEHYKEIFHDLSLQSIDPATLSPSQYKDYFLVPTNFNDAWNNPDPFQRKLWREAIMKEYGKMDTYKVYKLVKRNMIPKNRKCVKHKWVFDIKRNGVFRAKLVACGYSQQPGVDFTDSFSPVVNDSTFRTIIILEMVLKLKSRIIDIETAFLNGELEEEIYMDVPEGMEAEPDECLLLLKSLYGLVQSARQFFSKFREVLLRLGFSQSRSDPCLFSKQINGSLLLVAIYVDDCYVIGNNPDIEQFIVDLKSSGFKLKVENVPTDYLSCEIRFNRDKSCAWLGQPHLVKRLERSFGNLVPPNYKCSTPGTPSYNVVRPTSDAECIDPE